MLLFLLPHATRYGDYLDQIIEEQIDNIEEIHVSGYINKLGRMPMGENINIAGLITGESGVVLEEKQKNCFIGTLHFECKCQGLWSCYRGCRL